MSNAKTHPAVGIRTWRGVVILESGNAHDLDGWFNGMKRYSGVIRDGDGERVVRHQLHLRVRPEVAQRQMVQVHRARDTAVRLGRRLDVAAGYLGHGVPAELLA